MQGNVPPVAHDAWALSSPRHAPLAGEIIPMKRFRVEFACWPAWEPVQNGALVDEWFLSTRSVGRFWKVVFEIQV
jgi:hypothetical protein